MGKENIRFFTVWIILGNIFATFSSDPEAAAGVFGKTDLTLSSYFGTLLFHCISFMIHLEL